MKVGFFVLPILLLLSSCGKDMSVEDRLYQCMDDRFSEHDMEMESTIDSLEQFLFNKDVIVSKDGIGLRKYFEKIIEDGQLSTIPVNPFREKLIDIRFDQKFMKECLFETHKIDSTEYLNSTFGKLVTTIQDSIKKSGQFSVFMVAQIYLDNLTDEDLEHPFYRSYFLLSIEFMLDRDSAYIRKIPKKINEAPPLTDEVLKGAYIITIYPEGHLLNKGKKIITLEDLKEELVEHLNVMDEKTHVRMEVFPDTPYGLFTDVQGVIEQSYFEVWNNAALKKYRRNFMELDEGQQNEIKKEYRMRLIEVSKQK